MHIPQPARGIGLSVRYTGPSKRFRSGRGCDQRSVGGLAEGEEMMRTALIAWVGRATWAGALAASLFLLASAPAVAMPCTMNSQCSSGVCLTNCCTTGCDIDGGACSASSCDPSGACQYPSAQCTPPSCV